jgi:hypothetical protein
MRIRCLLVLLAVILSGCGSKPPSDSELIAEFHSHRANFGRLGELVKQYPLLSRLTQRPGSGLQALHDGLNVSAVIEYSFLLERTDTNRSLSGIDGLRARAIFVAYDPFCGLAGCTTDLRGYALDPEEPQPQVANLARWKPSDTPGSGYIAFRPLESGWFLFHMQLEN